MELLIYSLSDAIKYVPVKKTYSIRISSEYSMDHLFSLVESENWVRKTTYVFDDVWPRMFGGLDARDVVFDENLAQQILLDFKDYIPQTETLLVNCLRGMNRSPAVGIALNDIFGFDYNSYSLKRRFPESNWYVYDTLMKAGKDLKLLDK